MLASSRKKKGARSCMRRKNTYKQCLERKKNPKTEKEENSHFVRKCYSNRDDAKINLASFKSPNAENPQVFKRGSPAPPPRGPRTPDHPGLRTGLGPPPAGPARAPPPSPPAPPAALRGPSGPDGTGVLPLRAGPGPGPPLPPPRTGEQYVGPPHAAAPRRRRRPRVA